MIAKIAVMSLLVNLVLARNVGNDGGYSYNRFSGPVSGQIQQIKVEPGQGQAAQQHADYGYDHKTGRINPETQKYAHYNTVDYVAKPDYQYAYGVEDPHTGNTQNHKETRDGDVVRGEYSLTEADGTIRVVKYTADSKNGFQAVVHTEPAGGSNNKPQPQHQPKPAPYKSRENDRPRNYDRPREQYKQYDDYYSNNNNNRDY